MPDPDRKTDPPSQLWTAAEIFRRCGARIGDAGLAIGVSGALFLVGCGSTGEEVGPPPSPSAAQAGAAETLSPATDLASDPPAQAPAAVAEDSPLLTKVSTPRTESDLAVEQEALDLDQSGWNTEAFHGASFGRLKQLSKRMLHGTPLQADDVAEFVTEDFRCGPLRPAALDETFRDESLLVRRGPKTGADQATQYEGAAGFASALNELKSVFSDTQNVRAKFKQFQVELSEGYVSTTAYYHLGGIGREGSKEQNSTWYCQWTLPSSDGPPKLISVEVQDFEEVQQTGKSSTLFADCTTAVLGANPAFRDQLLYGTAYWRERIQRHLSVFFDGHHGVTVGDVNGDGLDDVYLCQPGGIPNRLFVQQPDGTAQDASHASGLDLLDATRSALLIDLDNDGDQDLVAATEWQVAVFFNNGQGVFALDGVHPEIQSGTSMAAADYDQDGDLDIYVCAYIDPSSGTQGFPAPIPYFDANNGASNLLLANDGTGHFREVTSDVGLDEDNHRFSYAAAWEDYDNDGDLDLYVANDFGRNCLYRCDDGRFSNVASELGLEDMAFGMSVSWADYNRDGHMDLYIGNMFSAAGNRITFQRQFKTDTADPIKARYQRTARGNTLFENNGKGKFRDVSLDAAVAMGRWSWGSLFLDLNNDGWEDLFVSNGYLTGSTTGDL